MIRRSKPLRRTRPRPVRPGLRRNRNGIPRLKDASRPFRITKDGREICLDTPTGREEYKRRREEMWIRDRGICCLCGRFVPEGAASFEHYDGRGMDGSRRDDRIEFNGIAHALGNAAKGSMRFDAYMQKPLEERIRLCRGW